MVNKLPNIWTIHMRKAYSGIRPADSCFPLPMVGDLLIVTDGVHDQRVVVTAVDEKMGVFDAEEKSGGES